MPECTGTFAASKGLRTQIAALERRFALTRALADAALSRAYHPAMEPGVRLRGWLGSDTVGGCNASAL